MRNPADHTPTVDGSPSEKRSSKTRARLPTATTGTERDAPKVLASGQLGSHRGLPLNTVVTTTLQELESAAGIAAPAALATDARRDPDGQPRPPLPAHL